MKNLIAKVALFAVAAAFTACQQMPYQPYARDVKKKPGQGGVIALKPEHREEDQAKARQMMANNCAGQAVKVLEEGEVAVGQEVKTAADTTKRAGMPGQQVGTLFGLPLTSTGTDPGESTSASSVTTSIKEWQISYECAAASKKK